MSSSPCFQQRWLALSCIAAGLCLASGCEHAPSTIEAKAQVEPANTDQVFQVAEAKLYSWPSAIRAQGTLIEDERVVLGATVASRVEEVFVDLGSQVAQGETVVALETKEFQLAVQQAEAQVAQARAILGLKAGIPDYQLDIEQAPAVLQEKALLAEADFNLDLRRSLFDKKVITKEEFQRFDAAHRVADARYHATVNAVQQLAAQLAVRRSDLAIVNEKLSDAVLKAPFAGMIQECHVAPGSYVDVGDPVVTLVRTNPLRFRAGIPERSSLAIRTGQLVRVSVAGGTPLDARISRISPSLDIANRSLTIEADIDNSAGTLRTGLFAEGEIVLGEEEQALAVPTSSLVEFAGLEKVWIVRGDRAQSQRVRTGRRTDQLVEILDGLKPGELILNDGTQGREGVVRIERGEPITRQEPTAESNPHTAESLNRSLTQTHR